MPYFCHIEAFFKAKISLFELFFEILRTSFASIRMTSGKIGNTLGILYQYDKISF